MTDKDKENLAKYASLGTQMMVIISIGTIGGYFLDKKLELSFPWFTLVLVILSVAAALWYALKDFFKEEKKKKKNKTNL